MIGGTKYDLRLYVLVVWASDTFHTWLYEEGIVRFCTRRYSDDVEDRYSQLTNTAINKSRADGYAPDTVEAFDGVRYALGEGDPPKWSIKSLSNHVGDVKWPAVWLAIQRLISKTVQPLHRIESERPGRAESSVKTFELFGFGKQKIISAVVVVLPN